VTNAIVISTFVILIRQPAEKDLFMILKSLTTGKIICKDLKIARSFIDRMFGLLIKTNPRNMLFKTRFGIHTFFLKEPVDVIVLNQDFKVVTLKKNLKPNRFFFWNPGYFNVLELPTGTISKFKIEPNQKLLIC